MATVLLDPPPAAAHTSTAAVEGRSVTFVGDREQITVPPCVVDLASFRHWMDCDDVPEKARIWYLKGEVWIDMSGEQIFSHLALKNEIYYVLTGLIKMGRLGLFLPDGLLMSNVTADISGKPDATFLSNAALDSKRVRLLEGKTHGYVEVEGSPDMVLEVVSDSSTRKDLVILRQAYWEAGIREYWLIDARRDPLSFDLLRRTAKGYTASRKQDGWLKSSVFGKSFRLSQNLDSRGYPEFTLEVR